MPSKSTTDATLHRRGGKRVIQRGSWKEESVKGSWERDWAERNFKKLCYYAVVSLINGYLLIIMHYVFTELFTSVFYQ